jgi:hypothetical protein
MRIYMGIVMALGLFLIGAAPVTAAPLADDTLKAMLENLGYTVTVGGDKIKTFKFEDSLPDDSLTFTITASISSDKSLLWLFTGLYKMPEGKTPPSGAMLALLAKNDTIGPDFFSYDDGGKLFYLNASAANIDITPAILRQKIKNFIATLGSTRDLWTPEKWH